MTNVTKSTVANKLLSNLGVIASPDAPSAEEYSDALGIVTSVIATLAGTGIAIPITPGATADEDSFDEKYLYPLIQACSLAGSIEFQTPDKNYGALSVLGTTELRRLVSVPLERTDDSPTVPADFY